MRSHPQPNPLEISVQVVAYKNSSLSGHADDVGDHIFVKNGLMLH